MLVIEVFKHSSNDLNLVRLFVVSKFIGLYLLFLFDLDLPEPAVHSLFIPVVEMERSSKLLSSSVLSVFFAEFIACLANSTMACSSFLLARGFFAPFFLRSSLCFSASFCRVRH